MSITDPGRIPESVSRYFVSTYNLDFFGFLRLDSSVRNRNHESSDFESFREYQKKLGNLYDIITEKYRKNITNKQEILNEIDINNHRLFSEIDEEKYNKSLDTIVKIFSILEKTMERFDPKHFLVEIRILDPSTIYFALNKFPHTTIYIEYLSDDRPLRLMFFSCGLMCLEIHNDRGEADRILQELRGSEIAKPSPNKKIRYHISLNEKDLCALIDRETEFGTTAELTELLRLPHGAEKTFEDSLEGIFLENMLYYDFLIIRSQEIVRDVVFLMNYLFSSLETDYDIALSTYTRWIITKNTFLDFAQHLIEDIQEKMKEMDRDRGIRSSTRNIKHLFERDYSDLFNESTDNFFGEYLSRIYPAKMKSLGYRLSKTNIVLGIFILSLSLIAPTLLSNSNPQEISHISEYFPFLLFFAGFALIFSQILKKIRCITF